MNCVIEELSNWAKKGFPRYGLYQLWIKPDDVKFPGNKEKLKEVIDQIKLEIPQKLSEVQ